MSWRPEPDGICEDLGAGTVAAVVEPQPRAVGGLTVQRLLPAIGRRMIGPFAFLDVADTALAPGAGLDVRPHPHIGLATVTYLFDGEIDHRDSVGSFQTIRPGDINWMIAGRGIAHSERSGAAARATGGRAHMVQQWVALPAADEEAAPRFEHHPAATLPGGDDDGARVRVLAGSAWGLTAPVTTFSPMFYADVALEPGAAVELPDDPAYEERAALIVDGEVCADRSLAFGPGRLVVFAAKHAARLTSEPGARLLLFGGAPVGPRHVWWNFVASTRERIEDAKRAWAEGRFAPVAGDDGEPIPLPG